MEGEIMSESKKANEDILNALHYTIAEKLAELLKKAKSDDDAELMLRVLREARGFLKDNNVTADITKNVPLQYIEGHVSNVAELPFKVEEGDN